MRKLFWLPAYVLATVIFPASSLHAENRPARTTLSKPPFSSCLETGVRRPRDEQNDENRMIMAAHPGHEIGEFSSEPAPAKWTIDLQYDGKIILLKPFNISFELPR